MQVLDYTDRSPREHRLRMRKPSEVIGVCIHQTAFAWSDSNPMIARIKAHYVVLQSGVVVALHPPLTRMLFGSGPTGNKTLVNVEVMGNYPTSPGKWWKPETYGRHVLADHPEQVAACRELVRHLRDTLPSVRTVTGHRALQAAKVGCPGPDLYQEVVMWSVANLGMLEGPRQAGGAEVPDAWRGVPCM